MNRQYIGARYVPKFFNNNGSNEWVSGIAYEALTIVTYLNNSYTSVKPVPSNVGSPNTATEYWACTGNVGGVVSQLQAEVDALEESIPVDLANNLKASKLFSNNISTHKFLYVGDSMLALTDNWGLQLDNIMSKTDSTFICEGGIGFHHVGNATGQDLSELITSHSSDIPEDVTDVIVYAGCNDCTASDYAYTGLGVEAVINALRTRLPNAKIWFAFNGTFTNGTGSTWDTVRPYIGFVYNYIVRVAPQHKNCCVMKSPSFACLDVSLTSDSTHPNSDGTLRIASAIANEIQGVEWNRPLVNNPSDNSRGLGYVTCLTDFVTVFGSIGGNLYNDADNPVSVVPHTNVDIGEINYLPLYPRYDNQFSFDCSVRLTATDDSNTYVQATIIIYHNKHMFINVHSGSTVSAKRITLDSTFNFTAPIYR